VPKASVADTIGWITRPTGWDKNQGDPGVSDKVLADVQFTASLLAAIETGQVRNERPLQDAVKRLLADQDASGAWIIEPKNALGSPSTWGTPLATHMALRALRHAPRAETETAMRKGEAWLLAHQPKDVPAAAALVLAFARSTGETGRQREAGLNFILTAQGSDGGWGPYANVPPEAFDTAIALLALAELDPTIEIKDRIIRGRMVLKQLQRPDGSWPATTRPAGGESYAQQLSTTGWATLALLKTGK
jgi:hypothetical protein